MARPTAIPATLCENAATRLPTAKITSPVTMTGLRPKRSDSQPYGI